MTDPHDEEQQKKRSFIGVPVLLLFLMGGVIFARSGVPERARRRLVTLVYYQSVENADFNGYLDSWDDVLVYLDRIDCDVLYILALLRQEQAEDRKIKLLFALATMHQAERTVHKDQVIQTLIEELSRAREGSFLWILTQDSLGAYTVAGPAEETPQPAEHYESPGGTNLAKRMPSPLVLLAFLDRR
ncbi:hypothetical protein JYT84_00230 [bacterium AH-315-M10]|nr:hypothetical protein [bacterium AH-315-M10]